MRSRIIIIKRKAVIFALLLLFLVPLSMIGSEPAFIHSNPPPKMTVVIDPGHGGIDGGTHDGQGILEKDINLKAGLMLKEYLESRNVNVVMTREEDISLEDKSRINSGRYRRDLNARKQIALSSNADFLVSLHVNANPREPDTRGAIVFYYPKSDDAKHLALTIGKYIENKVYKDFLKTDGRKPEVLPRNFYILREVSMPACLVEMGFLTNKEDKKLLQDDDYLRAITSAIGDGLIELAE